MTTKRQAARTLLKGALRAAREGDDICAVTLAGAAEGVIPAPDDHDAFASMRALRVELLGETERQAGEQLNAERNWLKHHGPHHADNIMISSTEDMLIRAFSRYSSIYGRDDIVREYRCFMGFPSD